MIIEVICVFVVFVVGFIVGFITMGLLQIKHEERENFSSYTQDANVSEERDITWVVEKI